MEVNSIGIVGGGQLGRMLTEAAKPMGFEVTVLDPTEYPCPAAQAGAEQIVGHLNDTEALTDLVSGSVVTTWEIEHIGAEQLMSLHHKGHDIQPSPYDLLKIQDKYEQKYFLQSNGIPVASFRQITGPASLQTAIERFGTVVVKSRWGGYDGRGNLELDKADWGKVVERFDNTKTTLYVEEKLALQKELSVLVARDSSNRLAVYPVIETLQKDGQCVLAVAPARIEDKYATEAKELALETAALLKGAGVFAIEMFLTSNNEVLVNEIAPRVHNSGHLTIEANRTSQFEQHIRAINGLPLGSTELISPAAMVNILGERNGSVALRGLENVLAHKDAHVHLYGKSPTKMARKMGHITVRAESADEAVKIATNARKELSI